MKLSAISETRFHYRDKIPPIDYVVNIASNMQVISVISIQFIGLTLVGLLVSNLLVDLFLFSFLHLT